MTALKRKPRSATMSILASERDARIVYEHMKLLLSPNIPNFIRSAGS
jgi:hypothetical protein